MVILCSFAVCAVCGVSSVLQVFVAHNRRRTATRQMCHFDSFRDEMILLIFLLRLWLCVLLSASQSVENSFISFGSDSRFLQFHRCDFANWLRTKDKTRLEFASNNCELCLCLFHKVFFFLLHFCAWNWISCAVADPLEGMRIVQRNVWNRTQWI